MFQYSFCSYSTDCTIFLQKVYKSFNTASVLIQLGCHSYSFLAFVSFNTASVLIQPVSNFYNFLVISFQYSFCSYSTYVICQNKKDFHCFNTASVLIQLFLCDIIIISSTVSIQLLFLFNKQRLVKKQRDQSFNTASVLIQLYCSPSSNTQISWFQYSFCSYSTHFDQHRYSSYYVSIQLLFLFNNGDSAGSDTKSLFQYSFCSYSTYKFLPLSSEEIRFNTASVLIQLLRLQCCTACHPRFNTASVLIQQNWIVSKTFIHTGFNTASVLIQPEWCCINSYQGWRFNTASVLIQP